MVAKTPQNSPLSQSMIEIDTIGRRILRVLVEDGRISNLELAARVGLSPSACLRRVQELERSLAITGYRAVVAPAARGAGFLAYVTVVLATHTKAAQAGFEAAIATAPEVRECHNVTGGIEYLLRVEVRDLAAYKYFHTEVLGVIPGLASITSYIVMDSPKDGRA